MEPEPERQYILEDIMKRRKKNQQAIENKLRSKMTLKSKKKNKQHLYKGPQKFIGRYLAAQKSYSYLKKRNKKIATTGINQRTNGHGKLLIVIRIRGVHDISDQQKTILRKLKLRQVNTAVFLKGTPAKLKLLEKVHNYITYGQPSLKTIRELIFKKMYGKVGEERLHINSNELVEEHIGGDIICIQDVVNQIVNMGENFQNVLQFIFPFKLTTPPNTLVSRLRKPLEDGGHWGYRANEIDQYISNMI